MLMSHEHCQHFPLLRLLTFFKEHLLALTSEGWDIKDFGKCHNYRESNQMGIVCVDLNLAASYLTASFLPSCAAPAALFGCALYLVSWLCSLCGQRAVTCHQ